MLEWSFILCISFSLRFGNRSFLISWFGGMVPEDIAALVMDWLLGSRWNCIWPLSSDGV